MARVQIKNIRKYLRLRSGYRSGVMDAELKLNEISEFEAAKLPEKDVWEVKLPENEGEIPIRKFFHPLVIPQSEVEFITWKICCRECFIIKNKTLFFFYFFLEKIYKIYTIISKVNRKKYMNLQQILQQKFWLASFREWQQEIIESIVWGTDTLVFMPTWWGKSLTYQLPWIARNWITLVISPLISLMKDQVDKLNDLWLRAELINSTIHYSQQQMILNELSATTGREENPIKFLYIAPERLNSDDFRRVISRLDIALVAIDEAHCISQWGHDFRPSYMRIRWFIESLRSNKQFPVVALTATATKKVRTDIVERIGLEDYREFTKGFDRKNIILVVREISKKEEKLSKLSQIVETTAGSGIVYCSSRKATKEVFDYLDQHGVSVWMYTGEMNAESRERMQNQFMQGELKVIAATNAFGMGIDKSDIRFVVHYNLPGSIENYYQEVWRAGRDGKNSFGIVIASYGDTKIQEFFIENAYPEKYEILEFYNYLYKWYALGQGAGDQIQKTYSQMAQESQLENDLKVWSVLKILEKYEVIKKGISWEVEDDFKGRGITLLLPKQSPEKLQIDWRHQELLKAEAYFKLEQVKKLLFYPSCRKKFILEYFWDEEDLKKIWNWCGVCDYCLDKDKLSKGKVENMVSLSVFEIVLDVIEKFDKKYGQKLITAFLRGSADKRILDWWLDRHDDYGVLSEYSSELVEALIEGLIWSGYLEKTTGQYPLVWLTKLGRASFRNEQILREDEPELQNYLIMKVKTTAFRKNKKSWVDKQNSKPKWSTYWETLQLYKGGSSLEEIAQKRDMTILTIESHILKLYEEWDLLLHEVLHLVDFDNLKKVKSILQEHFWWISEKLKPLKEALEWSWEHQISYFEIKAALAMIEKWDL